MFNSIIINADDCGLSDTVNRCIEKEINCGSISSTTIMANMPGFKGAVSLYHKYCDIVSFGWHINLTSGEPLTSSQILLDKGFYVEKDGKVLLNGQSFRRRYICSEMLFAIKRELLAQYSMLKDNGIQISHADGHHHIHASPSLALFMPSLFNELGISRCRRLRNYGVSFESRFFRQLWTIPFKIHGIRMPDYFDDFYTFSKNPNLMRCRGVIELECHPGHSDTHYIEEISMIHNTDFKELGLKKITYYNI